MMLWRPAGRLDAGADCWVRQIADLVARGRPPTLALKIVR
jgi:hypothetical protein